MGRCADKDRLDGLTPLECEIVVAVVTHFYARGFGAHPRDVAELLGKTSSKGPFRQKFATLARARWIKRVELDQPFGGAVVYYEPDFRGRQLCYPSLKAAK